MLSIPIVRLFRSPSTSDGTFGRVYLPSGATLFSGELPWNGNLTGISCIPIGTYVCIWRLSPRFGYTFYLRGTYPRELILIHPANYCGLAGNGRKQELRGCIALGKHIGKVNNQRLLLSSRIAIAQFNKEMNKTPFLLEIQNA